MNKAAPINYATVGWAVQQINQILLEKTGHLLSCEVDDNNQIVDIAVVTYADALRNGFEATRFAQKDNKQS